MRSMSLCSNSRPRSRSAIQGRCAYGHTPVFHSRRGGMRAPRTKTTATARVICLIDYQQSEQSRRRLWSRLREQVWSAERASVSASRMRRTSRNHICPTPATGRAQGDQQPPPRCARPPQGAEARRSHRGAVRHPRIGLSVSMSDFDCNLSRLNNFSKT